MVISDHGFTNFRRGVNLNSWLRDNGYLVLKDENARTSGDWFDGVDWTPHEGVRARPHRPVREPQGPRDARHRRGGRRVPRGSCRSSPRSSGARRPADRRALRAARRGVAPVLPRAVPLRRARPPDRLRGRLPPLLGVRDRRGDARRCSATTRKQLVGRPLRRPVDRARRASSATARSPPRRPRLVDIPASVLRLFGQPIPGYMQGEMIFAEPGARAEVRGHARPDAPRAERRRAGRADLPRARAARQQRIMTALGALGALAALARSRSPRTPRRAGRACSCSASTGWIR